MKIQGCIHLAKKLFCEIAWLFTTCNTKTVVLPAVT